MISISLLYEHNQVKYQRTIPIEEMDHTGKNLIQAVIAVAGKAVNIGDKTNLAKQKRLPYNRRFSFL